jgi:hypothetical protein
MVSVVPRRKVLIPKLIEELIPKLGTITGYVIEF